MRAIQIVRRAIDRIAPVVREELREQFIFKMPRYRVVKSYRIRGKDALAFIDHRTLEIGVNAEGVQRRLEETKDEVLTERAVIFALLHEVGHLKDLYHLDQEGRRALAEEYIAEPYGGDVEVRANEFALRAAFKLEERGLAPPLPKGMTLRKYHEWREKVREMVGKR